MAGYNSDFNSQNFRDGIRLAMTMALPNATSAQPLFNFASNPIYESSDNNGVPYNWLATPTFDATPKQSVSMLCLVALDDKIPGFESPIGQFQPGDGIIYLFETEWALIQDFVTVTYDGVVFNRVETLPPITLFDATLFRVKIHSDDMP